MAGPPSPEKTVQREGALRLSGGRAQTHGTEEKKIPLGVRVLRFSCAALTRVELLLHDEARGGEHAHAAVRELGLAPRADLVEGLAVKEVERVEPLERGDRAGEAVAGLRREPARARGLPVTKTPASLRRASLLLSAP